MFTLLYNKTSLSSLTRKKPTGIRPIVIDLLLIRRTLYVIMVMGVEHLFQWHNLGAKFHKSTKESTP